MASMDSKGYHEELDKLASECGSTAKMDLSGASDVELQDELRRRKEAKRKDFIVKWELHVSAVYAILSSPYAEDFLQLAGEHTGDCSDTDLNALFGLKNECVCIRCALLEQQAGYDGIPEGYFIQFDIVDKSHGLLK